MRFQYFAIRESPLPSRPHKDGDEDMKDLEQLWDLYEAAVQDPPYTVKVVETIYSKIFRRAPETLREDFCGTFAVGRSWIQSHAERRALGLDISKRVIRAATRRNRTLLAADEQRRARVVCADVRTVERVKADIILAENFSFFALKTRRGLLDYFEACYRSLKGEGAVVLDMVGGKNFLETPHSEKQKKRISPPREGLPKRFTYIMNQENYDPSTAFGRYSIDFELGKKRVRNAFTYDWRVWTLPEVRECLLEAGFDEVKIFWDDEKKRFSIREISSIPNRWGLWLCLVVGVKRSRSPRRLRN